MPISPENRKKYPPNWKEIRKSILTRAGHRCEGSPAFPTCRAENGLPHPMTGSKVVLTVAHMNHSPEDNRPENLRAYCQKCHLVYDATHHAMNAGKTRDKKKIEMIRSAWGITA
jgi:hypothetical protein